jgi:hypothetical protein
VTLVEAVKLIDELPPGTSRDRARAAVLSSGTTNPPDRVGGDGDDVKLVWFVGKMECTFTFYGPSTHVQVRPVYPLTGDEYRAVHIPPGG